MADLSFPFVPWPRGAGGAPKPVIPCIVKKGGKKAAIEALLDSGADWSVFPVNVAIELDIDIDARAGEWLSGICGQRHGCTLGFFHEVEVIVASKTVRCKAVFLKHGGDEYLPVLGRSGVFDAHIITFEPGRTIIKEL